MKPKPYWIFLFALALFARALAGSGRPEIRFNPPDFVYLYEANGGKGYYDAMLHFIGFVNRGKGEVTLESATIDVVKEGRVLQRIFLDRKDLDEAAAKGSRIQANGLLKLYDVYFRSCLFLGEAARLSPTRALAPGASLISMRNYVTVRGTPDHFHVILRYKSGAQTVREVSAGLRAVMYEQANRLVFPVKGAWWVGGGSDPHSDHRWMTCEEFALDLGQVDREGATHGGDGTRLEDYYCFGREAMAAADGEVVAARDDLPDETSFLRRPSESQDEYLERSAAFQAELVKKDVYLALGNYVVIRHPGDEYSCYAHLKSKSVRVRKGDAVRQGQVIGKVGQSGNSTEPHLHFQVNDGPDPLYSRSKPVKFSNLRLFENPCDSFLHDGFLVRAE